jgi:FADH2 O2-dependent halogenase
MRSGANTIVIVGSGFAGTILARALNARGRRVVLVERHTHPRFAIGESSTPLASICLERLAVEYDLPDLLALTTYGRWNRELPSIGHGLKRGFSFYRHRPNHAFANSPRNEARLLVGASPDNEIADSHWLRSDVDHHLVRRATSEGVEFIDNCEVERAERRGDGWALQMNRSGRSLRLDADFVVDATGGMPFLPADAKSEFNELTVRSAGISGERGRNSLGAKGVAPPDTGLIFGHFQGVASFSDVADEASFLKPPYPEERAAVHHLLEEGWMYVLSFDNDLVSAGFVIDRTHSDSHRFLNTPPDEAWQALMSRYPTIERQFAASEPTRKLTSVPRIQRRRVSGAGPGWALLPHAFSFVSPMFSTGIAWSLTGVERLAAALSNDGDRRLWKLSEHDRMLQTEADHITSLVTPAYRLRQDFDAFVAWTQVYFAAASYHEVWQRLSDPPSEEGWRGVGFLGACDPILRRAKVEATDQLETAYMDRSIKKKIRGSELENLVGQIIVNRNLAGLANPTRNRMYPVDLSLLLRHGDMLGLSDEELRVRLPRIRGKS